MISAIPNLAQDDETDRSSCLSLSPHPMARKELDQRSLEKIANFFKVFAEPTRLAILQFLRNGAAPVNDIVAALPTSQANVSKQLKVLHEADLLDREQRGNQVFYSISEELVFELCEIVCDKLNRQAKAEGSVYYEI